MDDAPRVEVLTPDQVNAVARHKITHDLGMCTCPCYDALMAVAASLPDRDRAMKLEGFLAGVSDARTKE